MILAVPSNGIHSNGYSLIRSIKKKVSIKLKKSFKPTKIYSKEVLRIIDKNLINAGAHIQVAD